MGERFVLLRMAKRQTNREDACGRGCLHALQQEEVPDVFRGKTNWILPTRSNAGPMDAGIPVLCAIRSAGRGIATNANCKSFKPDLNDARKAGLALRVSGSITGGKACLMFCLLAFGAKQK